MDRNLLIGVFVLLALLGAPGAQNQAIPANIQNPLGTLQQWLPVVSIAILLSICFAAILYMLGKFLNDSQISARGISELGQAIGTGIYAVLAIGALLLFGSLISHSSLITGGFSANVLGMCANFANSQLVIVNQNPTTLVCGVATAASSSSSSLSSTLDYGLASSYIIAANLTSQAASNIDGLYTYEGMLGYLQTLASDPGFCEPATVGIANCALFPMLPRWFSIDQSSNPLAGYQLLSSMTRPLEVQAIFIFYMLLTQLIISFLLMSIWPYLLGAGIILRALPFTRGAGGLLMGLTLVIVIVMPLITVIEYSALGQGASTSQLPVDSTQIQGNAIYGLKTGLSCPGLRTSCISIDWGDNTITNDYTLAHTYSQPNTYHIVATVTDQSGNQNIAGEYVTVPLPPAQMATSPDTAQSLWMAPPAIQGMTVSVCPAGPLGVCTYYNALTPNIYVFPDVKSIINYNGCWPAGGNLAAEEALDSVKMATLGVGSALNFGGFVTNSPPVSGIQCAPAGALGITLELMGVYGLMSIAGFVIPLFNILIIISAIKNASFLFGGDTDIAGLGKLV